MSTSDDPNAMLDCLSAPIGELIARLGCSVAEAQQALDSQAIDNFKQIYTESGEQLAALRSIGYRPTWYQIPEASAELQIALSIEGHCTGGRGARSGKGMRLYGAPVNAGYAGRYQYTMQASSKVSFKVVPVPPDSAMEDRRVVPNCLRQSLGEVKDLLTELDIAFTVDNPDAADQILISGQEPDAGTLITTDKSVTLSTS